MSLGLLLLKTPVLESDPYLAPYSGAWRSLISDFLYTPYDDGAGGTLRVFDFISKFEGANAGIFPFAGDDLATALNPLCGNSGQHLVNYGFVEGDLLPTGIQGDGVSYLETAIATNTVDFEDCFVAASADLVSGAFRNLVKGSEGINFRLGKRKDSLGTDPDDFSLLLSGSTEGGATASGSFSTGYAAFNAVSASEFNAYSGNSPTGANTTMRTTIVEDGVLEIFASASTGDMLIKMISIANSSLSDQQRTALYNATAALDTARTAL